jgi:alpha-ketoglutaric semialdehyde dehydrogenase
MTAVIESRSPQRPADVVVETAACDRPGVASAVNRARAAGREWAGAQPAVRAQALHDAGQALEAAAEEVARLVVREVGKPLGEAVAEVARAVAILRYYSQQAFDPDGETYPASAAPESLLLTRRRPRGVAGLITPWNFPVAIPLWKAAPALVFGNAVVLKPSPEATACALRITELVGPHLPDGVLEVLPGGAETGAAVVETVDVVSFTGSVDVGRGVAAAAAARGVAAQAEMGGKNASIVLADADLAATARAVASSAMGYAGQKCTATSRVVAVGGGDRFREALADAVEALRVGDPAEAGVEVGPVITGEARRRVLERAEAARRDGARLLTGGTDVGDDGWFVAPTVVDGLPPEHRLAQEEVFGPICTVHEAADLDEAIGICNGVRYGLVTSVFTGDVGAALDALHRIDTGLVRVNAPTTGVDFYAPFGGEKQSSYGPREQGKAARELYTTTRTIALHPPLRP